MKEIRRGDIFYCDLNPYRGSEQGGVRPVLVIQNDTGNRHSPTVIIAPITGSLNKSKLPTHVDISHSGLSVDSIVLLEQIQTRDRCRFSGYIGRLDDEAMKSVNEAIQISLGLYPRLHEIMKKTKRSVERKTSAPKPHDRNLICNRTNMGVHTMQ